MINHERALAGTFEELKIPPLAAWQKTVSPFLEQVVERFNFALELSLGLNKNKIKCIPKFPDRINQILTESIDLQSLYKTANYRVSSSKRIGSIREHYFNAGYEINNTNGRSNALFLFKEDLKMEPDWARLRTASMQTTFGLRLFDCGLYIRTQEARELRSEIKSLLNSYNPDTPSSTLFLADNEINSDIRTVRGSCYFNCTTLETGAGIVVRDYEIRAYHPSLNSHISIRYNSNAPGIIIFQNEIDYNGKAIAKGSEIRKPVEIEDLQLFSRFIDRSKSLLGMQEYY